jgi:hypothetical protein
LVKFLWSECWLSSNKCLFKFLGFGAGQKALQMLITQISLVLQAGSGATGANQSNFLGQQAGFGATNAF